VAGHGCGSEDEDARQAQPCAHTIDRWIVPVVGASGRARRGWRAHLAPLFEALGNSGIGGYAIEPRKPSVLMFSHSISVTFAPPRWFAAGGAANQ
jgi:hypothetical protein